MKAFKSALQVSVLTASVSLATAAETPSYDELMAAAEIVNEYLPRRVDDATEAVNVIALPGTFIYNYRLTQLAASDVTPELLRSDLYPVVTNQVCSTPETRKTFLERGVEVQYRYYGKDGTLIDILKIRLDDCDD